MGKLEDLELSIENFGSLFRFSYTSNLDVLFYHLADRGIYVWEGRNCFLSTAHSQADIDKVAEVVVDVARNLNRSGLLASNDGAQVTIPTGLAQEKVFPLTAAQKQLWVLSQVNEGGAAAYHIPLLLELNGEVDSERMARALQTVVDRNGTLRARIDPDSESQRIAPMIKVVLQYRDLTDSTPSLEDFVSGREPFDLTEAPLFRAELAKIGARRYWLFVETHHSMVDGQSLQIVISEWLDAYGGSEPDPSDAELSVSFADFVERQASQIGSEAWDCHRSFWFDTLKDAPYGIELPTDRNPLPVKTYSGGRLGDRAAPGTLDRVRSVSVELGATPFMLLLAAHAAWLCKLTGQRELVIGIPYSGRDFEGGNKVVGYCTHLLPIRISTQTGDGTGATLVRHVRERLLDALEHASYPFSHLLKELGQSGAADQRPLVNCTFNFDRVNRLPEVEGDRGYRLFRRRLPIRSSILEPT